MPPMKPMATCSTPASITPVVVVGTSLSLLPGLSEPPRARPFQRAVPQQPRFRGDHGNAWVARIHTLAVPSTVSTRPPGRCPFALARKMRAKSKTAMRFGISREIVKGCTGTRWGPTHCGFAAEEGVNFPGYSLLLSVDMEPSRRGRGSRPARLSHPSRCRRGICRLRRNMIGWCAGLSQRG